MYRRLLILACLGAPLAATAQSGNWRFGAVATGPVRLLNVNSLSVPDSNDSRVSLGLGFGLEAARGWTLKNHSSASLFARISAASVKSTVGGAAFSPGHAFIGELGAKIQREISPRTGLFAGAGIAHWSGPDETAPLAGSGAVLLTSEGGLSVRPTAEGPWHIDFTANLTRFGADDVRNVATGFVLRLMVGLRRDY